ncbi:MAG: hypothetical protein GY765_20805 [bacterium]|nr:hypothetical protein [bacterium]
MTFIIVGTKGTKEKEKRKEREKKRLLEAVSNLNTAMKESIRRRKQIEIIKMFGKIDYDDCYDYKSGR